MKNLWEVHKAKKWYLEKDWVVGCNFIPSNAINQLEMWQEETFDIKTIDRELGYAQNIGFNTIRVYLHDLLWIDNPTQFLERINQFLACATSHQISTILVLFDSCWCNYPHLGKQPEPIEGKHNSGWMQSPSTKILSTRSQWRYLKKYVQGVVSHFKDDLRILFWDVYNEPGNEGVMTNAFDLLRCVFEWIREINPSQPLSSAVWEYTEVYEEMNAYQLNQSDIITFHCYEFPQKLVSLIEKLELYNRPMICTEYMARHFNSTFQNYLPILKEKNIGAINWGLVNGKTQTHIPWNLFSRAGKIDFKKHDMWFHDIFYRDGRPYSQEEVDFILSKTRENRGS